ncbi:MAG TPA: GNAT family N-acetyltransferase [Rhodospirillales bacterium]|nr:GNAT family N-acetyltransferase [Rhodospirillales bacterium]
MRKIVHAAHDGLSMHPIRTLTSREHALYGQHLLRLSPTDRRLRFNFPADDAAIEAYVGKLAPPRDRILAHFADDLTVVGGVHIAFCRGDVVELAFSVEPANKGRGIGTALFSRAIVFARNRGGRSARTYCLAENREMRRLARRAGMEVHVAAGEGEGVLDLPAAAPFTMAGEVLAERAGVCDYGLKSYRQALRWHRGERTAA